MSDEPSDSELRPGEVTEDKLRGTVRRLLGDAGYAVAARRAAAHIAAMSDPMAVAETLRARYGNRPGEPADG